MASQLCGKHCAESLNPALSLAIPFVSAPRKEPCREQTGQHLPTGLLLESPKPRALRDGNPEARSFLEFFADSLGKLHQYQLRCLVCVRRHHWNPVPAAGSTAGLTPAPGGAPSCTVVFFAELEAAALKP